MKAKNEDYLELKKRRGKGKRRNIPAKEEKVYEKRQSCNKLLIRSKGRNAI